MSLRLAAVNNYKALVAMRQAMKALYPAAQHDRDVSVLRDNMKNQMVYKRNRLRGQPPSPPTIAEKEAIKTRIRQALETRRTHITVRIGSGAKATKDKGSAGITVGHMWVRRVWVNFYKDGLLRDTGWFVLKAEEVRVNHPFIRLYEATVYNHGSGETRPAYIGQLKVGSRKAEVKFTASQAASWAKAQYQHETNEIITGEST